MTNSKHTSSDLVERLRGDWPEILVEKHWMMDSDAIDKQREEAADRIEALEAEIKRKDRALWALTAWLLHRFGPNTPEGVEAQTARAALGSAKP